LSDKDGRDQRAQEHPVPAGRLGPGRARALGETLAAFDQALEEGQQIADSNRAAVEQAFEDLPTKPVPLAVSKQIASIMALDDYPFDNTVGGVDPVRRQRVVDVMQQFLGFNSSFKINSMLIGG
jgi:NitT/TauT family transport system substrate-binding protein